MKLADAIERVTARARSLIVSPHYIVLIQSDAIDLLKVDASSTKILFHQPAQDDFPLAFEHCLKQLLTTKQYWGQPVEILINDHEFFIYAKHLTANGASTTLQNLRMIHSPDMQWSQHTLIADKCSFFILQAINKTKLNQIIEISNRLKVAVLGITTLATYAITKYMQKSSQQIPVAIQLGGKPLAELSPTNDSLLYSVHSLGTTETPVASKSISLHEIGFGKLRWHSLVRALRIPTPSAKPAQIQTVVLGSLRLLNTILVTACIVFGLIAGGTSLSTDPIDAAAPTETEYQELYTEEHIHDSLVNVQEKQQAETRLLPPLIPLTSLFFQEKPNGAYLRNVTTKIQSRDSIVVTAEGVAANERAVFAYQNTVSALVAPLSFQILSIKPETIITEERVDSLTTFTLQLVTTHDQ